MCAPTMLNNENYRREICLLRLKAIYLRCFLVDLEIFSKSSLEVGSFLRHPLFCLYPSVQRSAESYDERNFRVQTTKIIDRKALPFKIKYVTLGLTETSCEYHT